MGSGLGSIAESCFQLIAVVTGRIAGFLVPGALNIAFGTSFSFLLFAFTLPQILGGNFQ